MTIVSRAVVDAGLDAGFPGREEVSATGVTLVVRATCRGEAAADAEPRPGARLLAEVRAAALGSGVRVRGTACLGNCKRGLSAALFRAGGWTYVFGGLGAGSAGDLVLGARLFAGSEDGFLPWRGRPEALKRGLVARVPHPDMLEDL